MPISVEVTRSAQLQAAVGVQRQRALDVAATASHAALEIVQRQNDDVIAYADRPFSRRQPQNVD